jgi:hypothetical protein
MYDNDEEFFAVLVENIYNSELKKGSSAPRTQVSQMDKNLQGSGLFRSANAFERSRNSPPKIPDLPRPCLTSRCRSIR